MKVVINTQFGGYGLSKLAYEYMGLDWDDYGYELDDDRTNPKLVECVEVLGEKANGKCASLKVVEVLDDVEWYIDEYDGIESIHEKHRIWA